jgi:Vesicle coat protein involved in Golgi to plasma membrane transport
MQLPQSIASQLSRPQAPTLRTTDPTTGYSYITTRHPKSQTRYSVLRTAVVRALSSELIPSRTGPVLFGDAHNGYTIAYVFAIDDPEARGGKREGRRWYAFLALFEGEVEATGAWPWVTKGFERMASGLRERNTRKESNDSASAKLDARMREDIEQGGLFQSTSLEERPPQQIKHTRGSFGNPEGFIRRPRFGNPGGTGSLSAATTKSLGELIGLEMVDIEIHSAMGWIMSGLLGPGRDFSPERPDTAETDRTVSVTQT